ncbi:MAG: glycosyltransferase [Acidobacteria bacterium]|nr:glycosyltransferase [Acidobacteriota bacterium]
MIPPPPERSADAAPLVSVITPTYNGSRYIAETIESALSQDYPRLEVIVADDGSTDDTPRVLDGFGDRIRRLRLPHRGENPARNAAVAASRGVYVAFLDHDDLWLPGKVAAQVELLEANPRAGLCHTGYQRLHAEGLGLALVRDEENPYQGSCFEAEFRKNGIGALTAMVRRSALPPYVFHEDIQISADYALWLDILFDHEALYIPKVLALHRQHPQQITHGRRERWKMYEAVSRMRLLNRVRHRMTAGEYERLRMWTLETLREAVYERRREGDHGWAALGFRLLRKYGRTEPWRARLSSEVLGRLQRLTAAGRAESRYLKTPA